MKLGILQKGLLLISIPLFCELVVFGVLVHLELDAEKSARKAADARAISDGVNRIEKDMHTVAKFLRSLKYEDALTADITPYCVKILTDVRRLRDVTPSRSDYTALFDRIEESVHQAQREIEHARRAIISEPSKAYGIIKHLRNTIDTVIGETLSSEVINLSEDYSEEREEAQAESARKDVRIFLFAGVPISLLATIAAALWFTKSIANRVNKLCADAELMSRGEALTPIMGGSDEIAQLDRIYHQSAQLLADSGRKLQAAFDYAADLILAIDSKLRIVNANRTSEEMLGIASEDLLTERIVNLIAEDDRDKFSKLISAAQAEPGKALTEEISLMNTDGSLIPTVCVPRYSKQENSTFCVFHNIAQRKEAEQIREEVFAMVTHDLRAPIVSFKGFLEMAEMGKIGTISESGAKLLPMAERSVSKMTQLVDDILTLEKLRNHVLKLELSSVSLDEVLQNCADSIYFAAEKRGVRIFRKPAPYSLMTDRNRLEQIILNLLSNALKFSPSGTHIHLTAESIDNNISIAIRDDGPGIKADELTKIFSRFYQGTKGDADLPSSGLGLTICKELADFLSAKLEVKSTIGKGSTFSIILPKDASRKEVEQSLL